MTTVFIIDREPERREAIASSFSKNGNVQEFRHRELPSLNSNCDILLIHYRDDNADLANLDRTIAVYYGGNGEPDGDWDRRQDQRINSERVWLAISPNGEGALTPQEAQELITYTESLKTSDPKPKPKFLQPPQDYSVLVAISILCQGHLVAFAHQSDDAAVKKTIEDMGYTPLVSQYLEQATERSTPYELWSVLSEDDIKAARTEWKILNESEKDASDSVEGFFDDIELVISNTEGVEEEFHIKVATEYPKLADRLGKIE